jgi:hypothetical protein
LTGQFYETYRISQFACIDLNKLNLLILLNRVGPLRGVPAARFAAKEMLPKSAGGAEAFAACFASEKNLG